MSDRRAFTLLELLIATAVAALLMMGVLAVVTSLGAAAIAREGTFPSEAASSEDTSDAWVRLLREDMAHADDVDVSKPNEVTLTGPAALGGSRRERTHRPVRVLYKLVDVKGRFWLLRRQTALDVLTNQNVQRGLVSSRVTRFELLRSAGKSPVKAVWRLRVWTGDGETPTHERLVTVRREDGA